MGKILKQAQEMQQKMVELQQEMVRRELEVTRGGGAVVVRMSLNQELRGLKIDPEFLKEEPQLVQETVAEAVKEALEQSKRQSQEAMQGLTEGLQMPGMPGLFG